VSECVVLHTTQHIKLILQSKGILILQCGNSISETSLHGRSTKAHNIQEKKMQKQSVSVDC